MRDTDWYRRKRKRIENLRSEMYDLQHQRVIRHRKEADPFEKCPFVLPSRLGSN